MANLDFFLDKLKEKAIELNNAELLNKLNEKSFNDSLNIVCDTMNNLGFEFKETGDKDFDYKKILILEYHVHYQKIILLFIMSM